MPIVSAEIPSEDLAALIVDELMDAGIVSQQEFESAVAIATQEIDARKYLRDYWCTECPNNPHKKTRKDEG